MSGGKATKDDKEKDKDKSEAPAAAGVKRKGTIVLIGAVVGSMAIAGAATFFLTRPKKNKDAKAESAATAPAAAESADKPAAGADAAADSAPSSDVGPNGKKLPPIYLDLSPSFVVNLEDDNVMRYLQVDIELMTRDEKSLPAVKNCLPRIRNVLMLLLSAQHVKDVSTAEGKQALERQALTQVQAVLRDETGSASIEALYFTNFVIQ